MDNITANHVNEEQSDGASSTDNMPPPKPGSSESKHKSSSSSHNGTSKSHSGHHSSSGDRAKSSSSSHSSSDKHKHTGSDKKHSSSGGGSGDVKKHSSSSSSSDKHKSSSSSSKSHNHSSSSSKSHSSSSSKHHSSSSSKNGSSSTHKSSSSSSKPKDGLSSSSSSNHKSSKDEVGKPTDGEGKKEHKSSSSSSSKSKENSDHKSSGSSSHKKDKHSSSSSKDKDKNGTVATKEIKTEVKDVKPDKGTLDVKKLNIPGLQGVNLGTKFVPVKLAPVKLAPSTPSPVKVKKEAPPSDDDDDVPLSSRQNISNNKRKSNNYEDSDEDAPLSARIKKKVKKEASDDEDDYKPKKKASSDSKKRKPAYSDEDDDDVPLSKRNSSAKKAVKNNNKKASATPTASPTKRKKKEEEEQEVWKWWEEDKVSDGTKWRFLEHKGPLLAPDYEPLPKSVKFLYKGKHMVLSQDAEEVATFYSKMLEHDYTTKEVFNNNFFKDWRKVMTKEEKEAITDLALCDFRNMAEYFKVKSEERKAMTKDEKQAIKKKNDETQKEYGFCTIDGHKEKIGNFRIEPPGLFRGRGEHPKMGMLKRRVWPEDVIINCSKGAKVPQPPPGHKWKEIKHDNSVSWLACWNENIQGSTKYVMLNAASKLKGEKDWQKYETARKLKKCAEKIRDNYRLDWKSKEMRIRQRAVALYFIDKLALRAGNEKDSDEAADTVGCCSLRVEHIQLHEEKDGNEFVVEFDFLGKDSIRYQNSVPIEKRVFKNLQLFMENKQGGDDLFDRLNTSILNKHLNDLMDGLTAKVFRTFNASKTLQEQLDLLTKEEDSVAEKILSYNRANRAVAILCNHQRAVPKTFDKSMENLQAKIDAKRDLVKDARREYKDAKKGRDAALTDKRKKTLARLEDQLVKLEVQATDKEENKDIALGTSKLNYLDPRISVAWCKKWDVPLEKVYNKTQRDKFRWAIDMAGPDFRF